VDAALKKLELEDFVKEFVFAREIAEDIAWYLLWFFGYFFIILFGAGVCSFCKKFTALTGQGVAFVRQNRARGPPLA
jgi:hypothetical protein